LKRSQKKRAEKVTHAIKAVYLLNRSSLQFINIKVEKCASHIFVLCGVKIFPAVEKDLSTEPDQPGIARYFRANTASRGYFAFCSLQ
jgi:hypothetical protein